MTKKNNYFNITREFAITDFKLRYQESILGVLWSFLRPLVMFGVLYMVFSKFARFDIKDYQFYLLLGILLWNFFSEATTASMIGLSSRAGLLKKINFPKSIIVVSSTLVAFLNFILGFIVFLSLLFYFHGVFFNGVIVTFLMSFVMLLVTLGLSFFLAAIHSKFKDVIHLWEIFLQMGFWITPIVYSVQMVPDRYQFLLILNPVFQIIEHSRNAMLYGVVLPMPALIKIVGFSFVVFLIGLLVFRSRQDYFAEEL